MNTPRKQQIGSRHFAESDQAISAMVTDMATGDAPTRTELAKAKLEFDGVLVLPDDLAVAIADLFWRMTHDEHVCRSEVEALDDRLRSLPGFWLNQARTVN